MTPATRLLPLFLSAIIALPAGAQLRADDSMAVIRTVERYHTALAAGDTIALKGMLSYGAVVMNRGFAGPFTGRSLESAIRFEQQIVRTPTSATARVFGIGAYVSIDSRLTPRGAPEGSRVDEAESIFLSRLGNTWFIELVHIRVRE